MWLNDGTPVAADTIGGVALGASREGAGVGLACGGGGVDARASPAGGELAGTWPAVRPNQPPRLNPVRAMRPTTTRISVGRRRTGASSASGSTETCYPCRTPLQYAGDRPVTAARALADTPLSPGR